MKHLPSQPYLGVGILNDPIHGYIRFTVPLTGRDEVTEKDIIDHPWVQRLRSIFQLQSARWVYPSAEHTRFQHCIGAMAVADLWARQVYPSLRAVCADTPSFGLVQALLRVTALLHDIGHGPFSHFFEENYLRPRGFSHEQIGARIVTTELGDLIRGIRRTPDHTLDPGETLQPEWVAYLMQKGRVENPTIPRWVRMLAPIFGGVYTADNMDYVLRDSYMCGVAIGPVDIHRLLYYTFFTPEGLAIHRAGSQALFMFLTARIYLYQNVYYHRTARAIDLQMRDIFPETMEELVHAPPEHHPEVYHRLTDWYILETVRDWIHAPPNSRRYRLGKAWQNLLERKIEWKSVYETTLTLATADHLQTLRIGTEEWEAMIRSALPESLRGLELRVDMAMKDARPLNPLQMGSHQIYIYEPTTRTVGKEALSRLLEWLPARVVQFRVFARNYTHADAVARAVRAVFAHLQVQFV